MRMSEADPMKGIWRECDPLRPISYVNGRYLTAKHAPDFDRNDV